MTFDTTSRVPAPRRRRVEDERPRRSRVPLVLLAVVAVPAVGTYLGVTVGRDTFVCTASERTPLAGLLPPGASEARNTNGRCRASFDTGEDKDVLYGRMSEDLASAGFSVTPPPEPALVSGPLVRGEKDGVTVAVWFESPEALSPVEKLRDPDERITVTLDSYRRSSSEPLMDSCVKTNAASVCGTRRP